MVARGPISPMEGPKWANRLIVVVLLFLFSYHSLLSSLCTADFCASYYDSFRPISDHIKNYIPKYESNMAILKEEAPDKAAFYENIFVILFISNFLLVLGLLYLRKEILSAVVAFLANNPHNKHLRRTSLILFLSILAIFFIYILTPPLAPSNVWSIHRFDLGVMARLFIIPVGLYCFGIFLAFIIALRKEKK